VIAEIALCLAGKPHRMPADFLAGLFLHRYAQSRRQEMTPEANSQDRPAVAEGMLNRFQFTS
jgi:hypothetical protein